MQLQTASAQVLAVAIRHVSTIVASSPGKNSPGDIPSPLSPKQLRKAAFLARNTRTKTQAAKDARKKPRPRLSVVLPDEYNIKDDHARLERESVTRKSVMISEIAVRTVSFLQALLCAEKETPGSLPKIRGEQFGHKDYKALCDKLGDMLASPVDKYLEDLSVHLSNEMSKADLQVTMASGSPVPITHKNKFAVKAWLHGKISEFHEPYRV